MALSTRGLSLIQILVMIALIGFVAAIAIPQFTAYRKKNDLQNEIKSEHLLAESVRSKAEPGKGIFTDQEICLAGLASENAWSENPTGGQSLIGRLLKSEGNNHFFLSPKGHVYECYLDGKRFIWRIKETDDGSIKDGRWRTLPDDGVTEYAVHGNKLSMITTYSDKSSGVKEYNKDLLVRYTTQAPITPPTKPGELPDYLKSVPVIDKKEAKTRSEPAEPPTRSYYGQQKQSETQVFKSVDKDGNVTFTDNPSR